jgi:hypothetical protein
MFGKNGTVRTPDRQTIRSSQRDIIMPDLACDLFENAICLSRFIELEKVSTSAVGKKNVSMTSTDVQT